MHVTWNVSNNILKYIMGEKDTPGICRDREEAKKFPHLWLKYDEEVGDYVMLKAP